MSEPFQRNLQLQQKSLLCEDIGEACFGTPVGDVCLSCQLCFEGDQVCIKGKIAWKIGGQQIFAIWSGKVCWNHKTQYMSFEIEFWALAVKYKFVGDFWIQDKCLYSTGYIRNLYTNKKKRTWENKKIYCLRGFEEEKA